jgi:hypothetical protein
VCCDNVCDAVVSDGPVREQGEGKGHGNRGSIVRGLGRLGIVGKVLSEEIAPAQDRATVIRFIRCSRADFPAIDDHLKRRKRRGSRFASVSDLQLCTTATASRHLAPVFVKLKSI